ncbi:DUF6285 domain-containing protein [Chelatococcus reniformis]|uniref:DUF6285 domain-containing protein n=1 Tax=Chelatococcus reniformis TaxID=1494448 RepID=A0A916U399_9HYPH|nr:DUF6285 domain-containing protein [Chelatococcus reniformis]GGC57041.1 hypothetical protein GCM10010994_14940 [Chelatococcus reniformis]
MPSSLPPAADLVAIVREFMERDILPGAKDAMWFNVKVATNLLATVERELRQGAQLDAAEDVRLRQFVDGGSREERVAALSEAIRTGRLDWQSEGLAEHLRQTCAEALAVNNPKWVG